MEQEQLYILANTDVDTSFLTLEMTWRGIRDPRIAEHVGRTLPHTIAEVVGGTVIHCHVQDDRFKEFIHACADSLLTKLELLSMLKEKTIAITGEIRRVSEESIGQLDSMSLEGLSQLLKKLCRLQAEATTYGTVVAFADVFGDISNGTMSILQSRKDLQYSLHMYHQILSQPEQKSLTEMATADIVSSEESDEALLQRYFWLEQGYVGRGLTKEQLQQVRSHNISHEVLPIKEGVMSELQLNEQEKNYFIVAQHLIFIKSLRADSRQYAHVVINRIVDMLAKRLAVEPWCVETLYAEELCSIIEGKSDIPVDIAERYRHAVYIAENQGYRMLLKEDAKKYLETVLFKQKIEQQDEVKGQVAQPGKVTGKVKLVFGPQHNGKVEDGDILISIATSPQLLPAMKRAAAYVTDVGGITSHAAIVARELRKPCVVGTKYATQIFKDGDMVEVDAENGTVTKLL